jgi:hypothetical protein
MAAAGGGLVQRHDGTEAVGAAPGLLSARPKRLRFLIYHTPGQVIHHAWQRLLRLAGTRERIAAMRWLFVPVPS